MLLAKESVLGRLDLGVQTNLRERGVSRRFARPQSGRIAVKAINHLGDEVMRVLGVWPQENGIGSRTAWTVEREAKSRRPLANETSYRVFVEHP